MNSTALSQRAERAITPSLACDLASSNQKTLTSLFRELRAHTPSYPSQGCKGNLEYYADVLYSDSRGGGDLVDVTAFSSKDFDYRIKLAVEHGKNRVADKLRAYKKRIGFVLVDAEGKGPAAQISALLALNVLKSHNNRDFDRYGEVTSRAMDCINDHFYDPSFRKRNISLDYGEVTELDKPKKTGAVAICKFVSAGTTLPLVYRAETGSFDSSVREGWATGGIIGMARSHILPDKGKSASHTNFKEGYGVNEFTLGASDIGLFFTDGYSDTGTVRKYPVERAEDILRKSGRISLQELHTRLLEDRIDYSEAPISDDLTLFLFRFRPAEPTSS
jgi:serine phosphatase RsbU (regulator of sigma subunit)